MKHISLFSGIGGFELAAKWTGWTNVASCEINPFGNKLLSQRYPEAYHHGDIKSLTYNILDNEIKRRFGDNWRSDGVILSGGFPCQDISYAKSWTTQDRYSVNGINGERSGLWGEYARLIYEVRPDWVLIENVAALTNQGLDIVLQTLTDIGYDAEWSIIPASYVGAPHLRKRIWIVAYPCCIGRNEEDLIFSNIFSQEVRYPSQWEPSRIICETNGKKALPESFGIHDGIPKGLYHAERITALGNSIVPQVAYQIFKAINEYNVQKR